METNGDIDIFLHLKACGDIDIWRLMEILTYGD